MQIGIIKRTTFPLILGRPAVERAVEREPERGQLIYTLRNEKSVRNIRSIYRMIGYV
jgi:hypothetical protein